LGMTVREGHRQAMEADSGQFLLQEKGLIYEQKHEGWYSVTDECFYPQSGVQPYLDPPTGRKMMVRLRWTMAGLQTDQPADIDRDGQ
jgi:methionyl-tRNA synthetase